jgi:hypothetical protein
MRESKPGAVTSGGGCGALKHPYSERRVCRAQGITRLSIRYLPQPRSNEGPLRASILHLVAQYGRSRNRQITGFLWQEGWGISRSRIVRPVAPDAPEACVELGLCDGSGR